jgi:CheY-like chemotaxis protein/nitrogen-specific signal transduction histidine kinase/HPt (histidine-containing phosphotransfer) domain-containing protein
MNNQMGKRKKVKKTKNNNEQNPETGKAQLENPAELPAAQQNAILMDQDKTKFMAGMSHEIRTSLNVIIGFSEVLAEQKMTDEQEEYVNIIKQSSENLLKLINDIFDITKIEAGKFYAEIVDYPMLKLLERLQVFIRPIAMKKQLAFEVIRRTKLPSVIRTDPVRLRQCLTNLISNAVKFTEQGHVHIKVSMEDVDDNGSAKPYIRFDIEDTGIGIEREKQKSIFGALSQTDGSITRRFGGTGLGLAITKQLAGLLGGNVSLVSEPGKGSVFTLRIPAGVDIKSLPNLKEDDFISEQIQKQMYESNENQKFSGLVLVAEDSQTNQLLIKLLLEQLGLQVVIAQNGEEAVDKALAGDFNLIFMNIQMPRMNGYEATRKLREKQVKIPIIALTAHAMKGDREKCLDVGCDSYLTKPIERKKLLQTLRKYLPAKSDEIKNSIDSMTSQVDELRELCRDETLIENQSEQNEQTSRHEDVINWNELIDICSKEDIARQVVDAFLKDAPRCMESIKEAVKDDNPKYLRMYAHSLKGAATQISAAPLSKIAHELENAGREKNMQQAKRLFEDIQKEFERVVTFLLQPDWIQNAKQNSNKQNN